jgi:hypothetical protein
VLQPSGLADVAPKRTALPMVGAFTALDGEQPRFLDLGLPGVDERAQIRAAAVRQGVWPPKGGPANLTKMTSTLCAPVPFSPLH